MLDVPQETKVHLVIQVIQDPQVTTQTACPVPPDSRALQAQTDVQVMVDQMAPLVLSDEEGLLGPLD